MYRLAVGKNQYVNVSSQIGVSAVHMTVATCTISERTHSAAAPTLPIGEVCLRSFAQRMRRLIPESHLVHAPAPERRP
jgi:hypothetical protein